jgi:hypothetical protein
MSVRLVKNRADARNCSCPDNKCLVFGEAVSDPIISEHNQTLYKNFSFSYDIPFFNHRLSFLSFWVPSCAVFIISVIAVVPYGFLSLYSVICSVHSAADNKSITIS